MATVLRYGSRAYGVQLVDKLHKYLTASALRRRHSTGTETEPGSSNAIDRHADVAVALDKEQGTPGGQRRPRHINAQ